MEWCNNIYINGCLPFGLHSAPKLFNILADLLSWIAQQQGISQTLHYLDNFLLVGPPIHHNTTTTSVPSCNCALTWAFHWPLKR